MTSDTTGFPSSLPADGDDSTPATAESTRAAMVRVTGSGYTPVRHIFVQKRDGMRRASTLGRLVKDKKRRELILYLLVLTTYSEVPRAPLPAAVWLRALDAGAKAGLTWSQSTLSDSWSNLVRLKLVSRHRERRRSRITPRREDRKGDYTRPDWRTAGDRYFILPGAFWTELWFDRLGLAGLAVLLILLKETNKEPEKHLTHAETARWYGISESTAKKGYQELVDHGLVTVRDERKRADWEENGLTKVRYYALTGAFSTEARALARSHAATERKRRLRRERAKSRTKKETSS